MVASLGLRWMGWHLFGLGFCGLGDITSGGCFWASCVGCFRFAGLGWVFDF